MYLTDGRNDDGTIRVVNSKQVVVDRNEWINSLAKLDELDIRNRQLRRELASLEDRYSKDHNQILTIMLGMTIWICIMMIFEFIV